MTIETRTERTAARLLSVGSEVLAEAIADALTSAGALTEWDSQTIELVLEPFASIVSKAGLPWVGNTGSDPASRRYWAVEARRRGMETDIDLCTECIEPLDDGEGYDGLCGNCADIADAGCRWT